MTTGAAAMTGQQGGDGQGGQGGGQQSSQQQGSQNQAFSWVGQNSEYQTFAQTKGWDNPEKAIVSYREMEKLLGSDKVPVPKDPADKEGWDRFYKAAGRPDNTDGYGIQPPQGSDGAFLKEALTEFHKAGLSGSQAKALADWYMGQEKAIGENEEKELSQRVATENGKLKESWGSNYDKNYEVADRAIQALGIPDETLAAMRDHPQIGVKMAMELMLKVGSMMQEGGFHQPGQGDHKPGFKAYTVEQAQARRDEILNNPDLRKQALTPGTELEKEIGKLSMLIASQEKR